MLQQLQSARQTLARLVHRLASARAGDLRMEQRSKRAREEDAHDEERGAAPPQPAVPGGGGGGSSSSSSASSSSTSPASSSSSSSSSSSAAAAAAPPAFRGPAADSLLGERLLDVIGIVAAMGFAAEVSHCLFLCGETYRRGDRGATNDMLEQSLRRQCGARAARAAAREDFEPEMGVLLRGSTQLIRAVHEDDLPRALQLIQLGAPLELAAVDLGETALQAACMRGREVIARALLDGKFEGRGADVNRAVLAGWTPLMTASFHGGGGAGGDGGGGGGGGGLVRLLLSRGARPELRDIDGRTALHAAVMGSEPGVIAALCANRATAAALLAQRDKGGLTPLAFAIKHGAAGCEAALRAEGATE